MPRPVVDPGGSPSPAVPHRGLVVFLENGGSFGGLALPPPMRRGLDFWSEEAAKWSLSWHGLRRLYHRVWILEDQRALPSELGSALLGGSRRHVVDLLILAHGQPEGIVGWQGALVGAEFLAEMRDWRRRDPAALRLGMVYTIACHSIHLAAGWLELGAQAVNGIGSENWFPEPTLSLFLRQWARGLPFGAAAVSAHARTLRWARPLLERDPVWKRRLAMSGQFVAGQADITLAHR